MSEYLKEACVENLMEAIEAYANGADQLELCSELDKDGLTPHIELVQDVVDAVDIPVKVMVRSRTGNFTYNSLEIEQMILQLEELKKLSISGIVFGALTSENQFDILTIKKICHAAGDLEVTIHKCIDLVEDYSAAIKSLKEIPNVKWILTSGCHTTAEEGKAVLKEMMTIAAPEIQIIPAGKILATNVQALHSFINAAIYHGRNILA